MVAPSDRLSKPGLNDLNEGGIGQGRGRIKYFLLISPTVNEFSSPDWRSKWGWRIGPRPGSNFFFLLGWHNYSFLFIYFRDNLNTDIFGANLYHRYLTRNRSGRSLASIAAVVTGRGAKTCQLEIDTSDEPVQASAEECCSILVQVLPPSF